MVSKMHVYLNIPLRVLPIVFLLQLLLLNCKTLVFHIKSFLLPHQNANLKMKFTQTGKLLRKCE